MENVEKFLKELSGLVDAHNKEIENKRKNGDFFNLFSVLNIQEKELIHSKMIADLLNPDGKHGQGKIFLEEFIKIVGLDDFEFIKEKEKVSVFVEYNIGKKGGNKGGRIDILLTSSTKHIIIENKIWAYDQEKQLLRYNNFGKKKKEFKLLYLSINGDEASKYSIGKSPFDYYKVSYKRNIKAWIEKCIASIKSEGSKNQLVNSLNQYLEIIKHLVGENMENKVVENIANDDEKIKSAIAIYDNFYKIRNEVMKAIFKGIGKEVKLKEHKCDYDEDFAFEYKEKYIYFGANKDNIYVSIKTYKSIRSEEKQGKQIEYFKEGKDTANPYGYNVLDNKHWNNSEGFQDIINRKDFFINTIVKIVKRIMKEINKITK